MSTPDIIIRRSQKADIRQIVRMEQKLFAEPWNEETFTELLYVCPSTFFVAETADGKVVGFVAAGLEDTGEEIYGHILNVGTASAYQKQGIGSRLLQRIEFECMLLGASAVQLEVRESNVNAQQFYSKMGYAQVFMIAAYYENREDAIVMMKWFNK